MVPASKNAAHNCAAVSARVIIAEVRFAWPSTSCFRAWIGDRRAGRRATSLPTASAFLRARVSPPNQATDLLSNPSLLHDRNLLNSRNSIQAGLQITTEAYMRQSTLMSLLVALILVPSVSWSQDAPFVRDVFDRLNAQR